MNIEKKTCLSMRAAGFMNDVLIKKSRRSKQSRNYIKDLRDTSTFKLFELLKGKAPQFSVRNSSFWETKVKHERLRFLVSEDGYWIKNLENGAVGCASDIDLKKFQKRGVAYEDIQPTLIFLDFLNEKHSD